MLAYCCDQIQFMFLGGRTGKHDDTESKLESEREESHSSSEDEDLSSGVII